MDRVSPARRPPASKFRRLAVTHALMTAGDAAMVVALADSLFFDIDLDAARLAGDVVPGRRVRPVPRRRAADRPVHRPGGRWAPIRHPSRGGRPGRAVGPDGPVPRRVGVVPARVRRARAAEDLRRLEVGDRAVDGAHRRGAGRGELEARADLRADRRRRGDPRRHPVEARRVRPSALIYGALLFGAALRSPPPSCRPTSSPPTPSTPRSRAAAHLQRAAGRDLHDGAAGDGRLHVLPSRVLAAVAGSGALWFGAVVGVSALASMVGNAIASPLRTRIREETMLTVSLFVCAGAGLLVAALGGPIGAVVLAGGPESDGRTRATQLREHRAARRARGEPRSGVRRLRDADSNWRGRSARSSPWRSRSRADRVPHRRRGRRRASIYLIGRGATAATGRDERSVAARGRARGRAPRSRSASARPKPMVNSGAEAVLAGAVDDALHECLAAGRLLGAEPDAQQPFDEDVVGTSIRRAGAVPPRRSAARCRR